MSNDAKPLTATPGSGTTKTTTKPEGFVSKLLHKGAGLLESAALAMEPEIEAAEKILAPTIEAAATAELGVVGGAVAAAATTAITTEGNQLVKDLGQPAPAAPETPVKPAI